MPDPHRIEKHKKLLIVHNVGWQNGSPLVLRLSTYIATYTSPHNEIRLAARKSRSTMEYVTGCVATWLLEVRRI
jgi:hypothetical protein